MNEIDDRRGFQLAHDVAAMSLDCRARDREQIGHFLFECPRTRRSNTRRSRIVSRCSTSPSPVSSSSVLSSEIWGARYRTPPRIVRSAPTISEAGWDLSAYPAAPARSISAARRGSSSTESPRIAQRGCSMWSLRTTAGPPASGTSTSTHAASSWTRSAIAIASVVDAASSITAPVASSRTRTPDRNAG